jgi:hypothetical protein
VSTKRTRAPGNYDRCGPGNIEANPTAWNAINDADLGLVIRQDVLERKTLIAENEALHQAQRRRKRG